MSDSEIISGHSHSFDTGVARQLGINAAIVYNHIIYWIKINASKKDAQMIDGKYWMYETQQQMAEFLEYMSLEEVKKAVVKLLDAGLLIKDNHNKNPFDRTAWYALPDQSVIKKTLTKAPYGAIDRTESAPSESAVRRDAKSHTAPSLHIQENNHTDKETIEQTTEVVSGCFSNANVSVSLEDQKTLDRKTEAFNWFMKIGCDVLSAKFFVENFSSEDIHQASGYVKKQIEKKKIKNEVIIDIIGYLRKTLENKWWIAQKSQVGRST